MWLDDDEVYGMEVEVVIHGEPVLVPAIASAWKAWA